MLHKLPFFDIDQDAIFAILDGVLKLQKPETDGLGSRKEQHTRPLHEPSTPPDCRSHRKEEHMITAAALSVLEAIGTFAMWLFRIPQPVPVMTVEMQMPPSEGRSYINFDAYDPTLQQQLRSNADLTEDPDVLS